MGMLEFDIYPLKNILTKALKDKEERVRASSVSVIQDKPSLVNKSDILKAWKKEDSYARRNYEYLMTKLDSISEKDEHTEDDLVFWISSKNINKINEFARNNLSSLKPYITGEDYNTKRLIAQSLRNIDDPKIYEMLGILLLDEDKETSLAALECLTAYKTEKAIDTMLLAIKNGANYQVEYKAVDSLESFGTFAVPIIIKKIKNMDDSKSKQCIAASLGRIGDEQAVDVLYDMMINDEARLVRLYSAQALKKIGWKPKDKSEEILFLLGAEKFKELVEFGEEAAEVLLRELRSEKDYIRSFIIDTLGDIGSKSAVKTLVNYAKFNKRDRTTTLEALTKIGHSLDVDTLLMFMNDSYDVLRQRAVYNAGHSKDPIIYEELIKFLKDKDKGVRYAAAFSLGDIGNKKAIPHLIKALKDDNEIVQDHSIRSLGVLKAKEAISVLIPFLDHNGYSMRNRTIWALGEIGEKKSIQKIEKFLDDPYDLVRRQTILSLGKLKSKKSISKIKELLEDKHEEVRKAAAEVIAELERS